MDSFFLSGIFQSMLGILFTPPSDSKEEARQKWLFFFYVPRFLYLYGIFLDHALTIDLAK